MAKPPSSQGQEEHASRDFWTQAPPPGPETRLERCRSATPGADDDFRACAIIPTFNNPKTIGRVTQRVALHVECVIVVDDGSDSTTAQVIAAMADWTGVVVIRRDQNGGKGAAVKAGLQRARELGFSHALQIDADGQHDLEDVERFLTAARREPRALILGTPKFDASVPRARLYGRRLTIFWSAVETGGRVISDPMCGFRVYPIAPALETRVRGEHMDFDPEVAVKLVWQGLAVRNLPTKVRYLAPEEGGVSNFRMVSDNLRISAMHTRLVCGALLRWLSAPWRRARSRRAWHQIPEAGNSWGIRLLAAICRGLGRWPARALLPLIVAYFVLTRPAARRASRNYLRRIGVRHDVWGSYRHLLRFAQCSVDRFFLLSNQLSRFEIARHGHALLLELARQRRGAILLGAHLGSFDALRALARSSDVRIHALGYFDNAERLNQELDRSGDNRSEQFVALKPGELSHLFRVKELVERGHFVAMLADRSTAGQTARVNFLGGPAQFPLGPYNMAAALGCPLLVTFGLHFAPNRYELYCEPLMDRVAKRRDDPDAPHRAAQAFAAKLEDYCRLAPDNWFNFYDFWDEEPQ